MFVPPSTGLRPSNIRFEDSTSGSNSSSSGSGSSSDSDSTTIRGPPIAAQVAKLKRLTKHSTPIYEDYMPASPIESPAASDSDTASLAEGGQSKRGKKRTRTPSSDDDDNDDIDSGTAAAADRPLTNDSIRQQLAKITAYLNSNAGKSKVNVGDGKEAKKESAEQPSKKAKDEASVGAEEKESDKKKVVKKQTKVITYSGRSNSKQPTGGLTFKERKALHTSLSQLTKITERVVGLAKNA